MSRVKGNENVKTAKFFNCTSEEFIGHWDGKPHVFPAGASKFMPYYLAEHFAWYLTNRELLRTNRSGVLIYKDGEKFTSPKTPTDVPKFMELFNKFCIVEKTENEETTNVDDDVEAVMEAREKNDLAEQSVDRKPGVQEVTSPDFSDAEEPKKPARGKK